MPARARAALLPVLVAAALAAVPAAPAGAATADWHVVALPASFAPADLVVVAGDPLFLTNADATQLHDVTSQDSDANGPLFGSGTVAFRGTVRVAGVESLDVGVWPFLCSVHPFMTGTIRVVAAP
jgi:plastocyanin